MKALVTGASSGIGMETARILSKYGYDIIAVARRRERLEALASELDTDVDVISTDLSDTENCKSLYERVKNEDIEIIVNDAGFGLLGEFVSTDLDRELEMVDLNCKALHTLTKLFLQKFTEENRGYILNICSIGGFLPGPLMATYYATKAYVLSLTHGIYEEIRRSGKNIYIGCVCPGPVATEFLSIANVRFSLKARTPQKIAEYAVKKMFHRKLTIIPGFEVKLIALFSKIPPIKLVTKISYKVQHKKV